MKEYDLSNVSEEDRAYIEELILEEAEHQKYNGALEDFKKDAYPWQRDLANLSSDHRIIAGIAGNRVGKTYTIAGIVAMHLTGDYADWYTGKRFDGPIKAYFAGVDSNHNRGVPQKYLFGTSNRMLTDEIGTGFIPRSNIVFESMLLEKKGVIQGASIRHKSGGYSTLEFKSYSQGSDAAQGFSAHIVVVDEQPPDEYFSELVKRTMVTDQGAGLVYCGFTPLKGETPLVTKFWNLPLSSDYLSKVKSGKEIAIDEQDKPENKGLERWATVNANWDDVPHLTEKEKEETLAATPRYLWEAVKNGVPVAGKGRVYPHDQSKIVYEPGSIVIPDKWEWLIGVDIGFGTRDPAAGIMLAWDKENDIVYITDEFKHNVHTEDEMARAIWGLDSNIPVAWPDDAGRKGFKGQGTVQTLLSDLGVNMLPKWFENPPDMRQKSHKALQPGFAHINSRLYSGKMKISTNCVMLLKEMANYQYKDEAGVEVTGVHHTCDAMRYAVLSVIQGYGSPKGTKRNDYWDNDDIWENYNVNTY